MHESKPIKCLVVDDEPPAREIIARYIAEVPMLELAGECANAVQAMSFLQHHPVGLLFLDIRLPQLNGNELLKILKNPPKVIFTTAHAEYALEGYELDIVDYLLKPVQFDRFLKAVHKAVQTAYAEPAQIVPELKQQAFVYFRADRKMVKVMLNDIFYIESMKDYIKVVTTKGVIITKQSISSVEEMLPEDLFLRTHRSFIVALPKIRSYTSELIEIEKMEIPIGKLFRNGVMKVLG
jgi:two-component system LytT family response regulator